MKMGLKGVKFRILFIRREFNLLLLFPLLMGPYPVFYPVCFCDVDVQISCLEMFGFPFFAIFAS